MKFSKGQPGSSSYISGILKLAYTRILFSLLTQEGFLVYGLIHRSFEHLSWDRYNGRVLKWVRLDAGPNGTLSPVRRCI